MALDEGLAHLCLGLVVVGPSMRMGLRRLSSTGGSGAVQGVEVFASVGAAAERLKLKDEIIKDAASAAPHAALPVASAEGLKPTKFMRNNLVKQSGVPGVLWNSTCFAWEVQIPKYDSEGKRKRRDKPKVFDQQVHGQWAALRQRLMRPLWRPPRPFMLSWCARASSRSRKERDPTFTSDVPGVAVEQGEQEVASEDFFEEKQSEGATEKRFLAVMKSLMEVVCPLILA